jgi:hypothetical protein
MAAAAALIAAMLACTLPGQPNLQEVTTDTETVEAGSATSARVEISFPVGELRVTDGAAGLMEATFRTNVAGWEPLVAYSVQDGQGDLKVSQPGAEGANVLPFGEMAGDMVNSWSIQLSADMPLDLSLQIGAGESTVDLSRLDVSQASIAGGAGTASIDLAGSWQHDVRASIEGGVGRLQIDLPSEMGVRVVPDTGLVAVSTAGLTQDGTDYVNAAYGTAPYTLTVDLSAGVGAVELRVR